MNVEFAGCGAVGVSVVVWALFVVNFFLLIRDSVEYDVLIGEDPGLSDVVVEYWGTLELIESGDGKVFVVKMGGIIVGVAVCGDVNGLVVSLYVDEWVTVCSIVDVNVAFLEFGIFDVIPVVIGLTNIVLS